MAYVFIAVYTSFCCYWPVSADCCHISVNAYTFTNAIFPGQIACYRNSEAYPSPGKCRPLVCTAAVGLLASVETGYATKKINTPSRLARSSESRCRECTLFPERISPVWISYRQSSLDTRISSISLNKCNRPYHNIIVQKFEAIFFYRHHVKFLIID